MIAHFWLAFIWLKSEKDQWSRIVLSAWFSREHGPGFDQLGFSREHGPGLDQLEFSREHGPGLDQLGFSREHGLDVCYFTCI